ncbi:response regulator [Flammeovirga sp. MY04]|uniref:hybrid sensor histidine kinase/response regulator transcription factor n=1 Tax=Flammeovirga sp. MY04 TaxID=1191459 RepID=UPI0008061854|nr:hybrid sensor histidine kinase/response regulator transcription factor [Flammeovirga sp. MY04]ANQ52477.1 response regulator [Flammeovirga sp. MY04]
MKNIILLSLFFLLPFNSYTSVRNYEFTKVDIASRADDVKAILEDDKGYIWLALSNELFRYDGFQFEKMRSARVSCFAKDLNGNIYIAAENQVYQYSYENNTFEVVSRFDSYRKIHNLYVSSKNELLICSSKGLEMINLDDNSKVTYQHHEGIDEGLTSNVVRVIYEDKKGDFWIGTHDQLNKLDRKTNTFTRYRLQTPDEIYKKNNLIIDILPLKDKDDTKLYVGTETGLAVFDTESGSFIKYRYQKNNKKSISNNVVRSLVRINEEMIWVGTGHGLNIFDESTKSFQQFYSDYYNQFSIAGNSINQIYKDNRGITWFCSDNGLSRITLGDDTFNLNRLPFSNQLLDKELTIKAMKSDASGNMWIATDNSGLIKYDRKSDSFHSFKVPQILHNNVNDVIIDKEGDVWLVTPGGLNIIDPKTNKISAYTAERGKKGTLKTDYLFSIAESPKGQVWIGSMYGVYKVEKNDQGKLSFLSFRPNNKQSNTISGDYIYSIFFNENENPYIATGNGLDYFDLTTGTISKVKSNEKLNYKYLKLLKKDQSGTIWAISENRFFKLNTASNRFEEAIEAPSKILSYEILEDKIWYTTTSKLNLFDQKSNLSFSFSYESTGINHFVQKVSMKYQDYLVFGGKRGFTCFDPKSVSLVSDVPKVRFSSLNVLNREITPQTKLNEHNVITNTIDHVEKIELEHDENTFGLSFSGLDFRLDNAHEYRVQLEGLEDDWKILPANEHSVSYIKVKPGKYIFKVMASDQFGKFSDEYKSLEIIIHPPIWATWWAKAIYFIVICVVFFLAKRMTEKNINTQNNLEIEKLKREQSEEVNQMKISFFTNVSHELRTPLTLITSPLSELSAMESDTNKKKLLQIIERNTDRLTRLVNQILDLRKLDKDAEKLRLEKFDMVKLCKSITNDFTEIVSKRNINLNFYTKQPELKFWFDSEKIEKVIYNLISNALKYTPNNERIEILLNVVHIETNGNQQQYVEIKVKDTGLGIPKEVQSQIFERFINVKTENYTGQQGTGIGLSLVNDYVKMHEGWVELESELGEGAEFIIYLPYESHQMEVEQEEEIHEEDFVITTSESDEELTQEQNSQYKLLIVEDDEDMQSFIAHCFESDYKIFKANNGKEGWEIAKKEMPDLIISDWMMPVMDGIKFCNKLKVNVLTNHIPVIMLSAKDGIDNKMQGIDKGADDYIAKPFNVDYLKLRVQKILLQRDKLKAKYKAEFSSQVQPISDAPTFEEKFLQKVVDEIEKDIDNSEFNVKMLGEALGMGQTNLYRKIKAMTDMTINEFIRNVRMKKAGQLLRQGEYNVSDVMYMVGFTHRSYFSKSFKEMYGMTPKEFLKNNEVDA